MSGKRRAPDRVVSFQSTNSVDLDEAKELKAITAEDKFPCYACFDKTVERLNCEVCNKKGFISGDHPMVKFVEDFLQKNLAQNLNAPQQGRDSFFDGSQHASLSSDDQKIPNQRLRVQKKKEVRSALDHYPRDSTSEAEGSYMMKSSNEPKSKQECHFGYACDICSQDPISGPRYNCLTCEDYDLCEKCFKTANHEHEMKRICKEKNQCLLQSSIVLDTLRRSTRCKK